MSSSKKSPLPTPSPAPRRKIAAVKKPLTVEDESTLFCIIRNGKSSVQVLNHQTPQLE
jgi:cohesin complex subunit SA-1/2